jgi:hypothetical protein
MEVNPGQISRPTPNQNNNVYTKRPYIIGIKLVSDEPKSFCHNNHINGHQLTSGKYGQAHRDRQCNSICWSRNLEEALVLIGSLFTLSDRMSHFYSRRTD